MWKALFLLQLIFCSLSHPPRSILLLLPNTIGSSVIAVLTVGTSKTSLIQGFLSSGIPNSIILVIVIVFVIM
jgi:hypothetical protein